MTRYLMLLLALSAPAFAGPGGERGGPPSEVIERVRAHEDEILAAVKQMGSERYDKLMVLKAKDRRAYTLQLVRIAKALRHSQGDPDALKRMAEIEALKDKARGLRQGYNQLEGKAAKARRAEIRAVVLELFDAKQAERSARITKLKQRIDELQQEIDERASKRNEIVDKYLDQMLHEKVAL